MEWAHNATIGWQAGSSYFRNHPLSTTANANLVACLNSPHHSAANVVFQLSSVCKYLSQGHDVTIYLLHLLYLLHLVG